MPTQQKLKKKHCKQQQRTLKPDEATTQAADEQAPSQPQAHGKQATHTHQRPPHRPVPSNGRTNTERRQQFHHKPTPANTDAAQATPPLSHEVHTGRQIQKALPDGLRQPVTQRSQPTPPKTPSTPVRLEAALVVESMVGFGRGTVVSPENCQPRTDH